MSGAAARARAMVDRAIRHFGEGATITLRRRHTLRSRVTGSSSVALVVSGAHALGASSVLLAASGLAGDVPAGVQFTIAGDATVYEVTTAASSSGGSISLPITPALVVGAGDGAAVTISRAYGEATFAIVRRRIADDSEEGAGSTWRRLHLSTVGATWRPAVGDLVADASELEAVVEVEELDPGAGSVRYSIAVGTRGAP